MRTKGAETYHSTLYHNIGLIRNCCTCNCCFLIGFDQHGVTVYHVGYFITTQSVRKCNGSTLLALCLKHGKLDWMKTPAGSTYPRTISPEGCKTACLLTWIAVAAAFFITTPRRALCSGNIQWQLYRPAAWRLMKQIQSQRLWSDKHLRACARWSVANARTCSHAHSCPHTLIHLYALAHARTCLYR